MLNFLSLLLCADHYTGLSDAWSAGPIFCSEVTAKLVVYLLGVQPDLVRPLPMDEPVTIQGAPPCRLQVAADIAAKASVLSVGGLWCTSCSWQVSWVASCRKRPGWAA